MRYAAQTDGSFPLGAIGLFPFLMWRLFRGGVRIKPLLCSVEAWSGLLILIACAPYYARSDVPPRILIPYILKTPPTR